MLRSIALTCLLTILSSIASGQTKTRALAGPAALGGPTTTGATVATPAPSWVSATLAAWMLDEATGTRTNAQGTASRDLAMTGTVGNDTTNKMEGTASANLGSGSLSVLDAGIDALASPFAYGCWERPVGGSGMRAIERYTAPNGTLQDWAPAGANFYISSATESLRASGVTPGFPASAWTHVVNRFIAPNITMILNGGTIAARDDNSTGMGVASISYKLSGTPGFTGQLDECFIYAGALSNAAVCRICSCGLRGEQCTCQGTSYGSKGRNATSCGTCTLPAACNAAGPT